MFSKNLLKLSSFAINITNLMTRTNRMMKTIMKTNDWPKIRWINDNSNSRFELPSLMKFDLKGTQFPPMIPSKISFFYKIIVDKSYNENRFVEQAKQIVSKISYHLANDNIQGIETLVTKEAFEELSQNYKNLSSEQKRELKVDINDILQCFPLGIKVNRVAKNVFDVKILVLIEVLNNSSNEMNQNILSHTQTKEFFDESIDLKFKILEPLIDQKHLCVYEFSRKFGPQESTNWLISRLTHFRYKDICKDGTIH